MPQAPWKHVSAVAAGHRLDHHCRSSGTPWRQATLCIGTQRQQRHNVIVTVPHGPSHFTARNIQTCVLPELLVELLSFVLQLLPSVLSLTPPLFSPALPFVCCQVIASAACVSLVCQVPLKILFQTLTITTYSYPFLSLREFTWRFGTIFLLLLDFCCCCCCCCSYGFHQQKVLFN